MAHAMESAVLWSWLFNGLRLASGVLLLPLLARILPMPDFGMYYVFLRLAAIVPMMDFGFSLSVERGLAYALGGAGSIVAHGVGGGDVSGRPNDQLVQEVIHSSRKLYRGLALGGFALMVTIGTPIVGMTVAETTRPDFTWMAWAIYGVSSSLEIYTGYWIASLRGLNRITQSARWMAAGYGLKLALSIALLLAGAGLAAVPIAGLVGSLVVRVGAGRELARCVRVDPVAIRPGTVRRVLGALWPNTWRLGVQLMALFLSTGAFTWICSRQIRAGLWDMKVLGQYGLSIQIMTIALGIAAVATSVKWPLIAQLRIRGDYAGMRAVLWPRFWLQVGTFLVLAGAAVLFGSDLLALIDPAKQMLPRALLLLLLLDALGQLNFSLWTTLISTENRIPAVWPLVATHVAGVIMAAVLVFRFGWDVSALVITPPILGSLFNYWWWAREGTRVLRTTFPRFLVSPRVTFHGSV